MAIQGQDCIAFLEVLQPDVAQRVGYFLDGDVVVPLLGYVWLPQEEAVAAMLELTDEVEAVVIERSHL